MLESGACRGGPTLERQDRPGICHRHHHPMVLQKALQAWHIVRGRPFRNRDLQRCRNRLPHLASFFHLLPELGEDVGQGGQRHGQVFRVIQRQPFHPRACPANRFDCTPHQALHLQFLWGVLRLCRNTSASMFLHQGWQHLFRQPFSDQEHAPSGLQFQAQILETFP